MWCESYCLYGTMVGQAIVNVWMNNKRGGRVATVCLGVVITNGGTHHNLNSVPLVARCALHENASSVFHRLLTWHKFAPLLWASARAAVTPQSAILTVGATHQKQIRNVARLLPCFCPIGPYAYLPRMSAMLLITYPATAPQVLYGLLSSHT